MLANLDSLPASPTTTTRNPASSKTSDACETEGILSAISPYQSLLGSIYNTTIIVPGAEVSACRYFEWKSVRFAAFAVAVLH